MVFTILYYSYGENQQADGEWEWNEGSWAGFLSPEKIATFIFDPHLVGLEIDGVFYKAIWPWA